MNRNRILLPAVQIGYWSIASLAVFAAAWYAADAVHLSDAIIRAFLAGGFAFTSALLIYGLFLAPWYEVRSEDDPHKLAGVKQSILKFAEIAARGVLDGDEHWSRSHLARLMMSLRETCRPYALADDAVGACLAINALFMQPGISVPDVEANVIHAVKDAEAEAVAACDRVCDSSTRYRIYKFLEYLNSNLTTLRKENLPC